MSVETEAKAIGSYWDGHPTPPQEPATDQAKTEFSQKMADWESKFGPGGPPDPPDPPAVPGPPSPGAGMPAARLTDLCAHGGVITSPGCPTVLIGSLPAARVTDMAICPMFDVLVPHVSGLIIKGSNTVLIGYLPAARVSDPVGPPANCKGNVIAMGCMTVLIGDQGGGGGGSAAVAEVLAKKAQEAKKTEAVAQAQSTAAALVSAAAAGTPLIEICPACAAMREAAQTKHMVAFRVVDDKTDQPIVGVALKVTLPDGTEAPYTTDANGMIEIDDLDEAGDCSVTCDYKGGQLTNTYDFVRMGEFATSSESEQAPSASASAPTAAATPSPASPAPGEKAASADTAAKKDLSGKSWVSWRDSNVSKSNSLDDLSSPFKENAKAFIDALKAAGATVSVTDTLRDKKEAYLWHWAWKIDQDGYDPTTVPANADVPIEWNHGENAKSKAGAKEMVDGFGLAVKPKSKYAPALDSNHLSGKAVDMDISWSGDLKIKKKDGTEVTISSEPKTSAGNTDLHKVGESYGVKKLIGDDPHWSHNGN